MSVLVALSSFLFVFSGTVNAATKWDKSPNIIFIMADDLGWNDVGFHGSNQIPTPNIDALAYSGIILQNYYMNPLCTPSRSSLMTGRYPIHTGMQHYVISGDEPWGLPLNEKLLPEYLEPLGYVNRIVGKWHLGSYTKDYTPTYRGFQSHLGCWTGFVDYNDHTSIEPTRWGLDMRRNLDVDYDSHGKYVTDLYTEEAVRLIDEHNVTKPLFLYLAHNAVHSGNAYNPLAAPEDLIAQFGNISDYRRRRFAGVLSKLDESVGKVVAALHQRDMLKNSVIVFSTDNGGAAEGLNDNAASNWPLRGVKFTLWEGGIRGAGLVWSPSFKKPKRVANQMMHMVDWLPTLLHAAAGPEYSKNITSPYKLDGLDLWDELSNDYASKRDTVLHNIDNIDGTSAVTKGDWKFVQGSNEAAWDTWYGPSGRTGEYDPQLVLNSPAGLALSEITVAPTLEVIADMREKADVKCPEVEEILCEPLKTPCLFNLKKDPCERQNLAKAYPNILQQMEDILDAFNKTSIPPGNKPAVPEGDPKLWNNVWNNFGDYANHSKLDSSSSSVPWSIYIEDFDCHGLMYRFMKAVTSLVGFVV